MTSACLATTGWTRGLAVCPVTAVWKALYLTTARRKDSVTVDQVSLGNSVTGVHMVSMHSRMAAAHPVTVLIPRITVTPPLESVSARLTRRG